jgi:peptidoglycan/LPS O-acetylase OafA/YrhL
MNVLVRRGAPIRALDRLPALDGLRAVAILLVVASHVLTHNIPGGLGVTLFFFISGFIITRMLLNEDFDRSHMLPFYVRRFFRLAPALLVFVAISCAAMALVGMPQPAADVLAALFYYANYHAFWVDAQTQVLSPLGITWSLAVEEHFYVLFPLLLLAVRRRTDRLQIVLWVVIAAALLWRIVLFGSVPNERIYQGTDTRFDSIAWGCLLSTLMHRERGGAPSRVLEALSSRAALVLGFALLLATLLVRDPRFRETIRYSLQGLAFVPMFCALFRGGSGSRGAPALLRAVLESRAMVFIGAVSYSLYFYHFLGLSIASALFAPATLARAALALLLGAIGTLFSYHLIETPTRRFGARWAKRLSPRGALGDAAPMRADVP